MLRGGYQGLSHSPAPQTSQYSGGLDTRHVQRARLTGFPHPATSFPPCAALPSGNAQAQAPAPAPLPNASSLDFEYTAYALLNTEPKPRAMKGRDGKPPVKKGKLKQNKRGFRMFETMQGNASAASLLYDDEDAGAESEAASRENTGAMIMESSTPSAPNAHHLPQPGSTSQFDPSHDLSSGPAHTTLSRRSSHVLNNSVDVATSTTKPTYLGELFPEVAPPCLPAHIAAPAALFHPTTPKALEKHGQCQSQPLLSSQSRAAFHASQPLQQSQYALVRHAHMSNSQLGLLAPHQQLHSQQQEQKQQQLMLIEDHHEQHQQHLSLQHMQQPVTRSLQVLGQTRVLASTHHSPNHHLSPLHPTRACSILSSQQPHLGDMQPTPQAQPLLTLTREAAPLQIQPAQRMQPPPSGATAAASQQPPPSGSHGTSSPQNPDTSPNKATRQQRRYQRTSSKRAAHTQQPSLKQYLQPEQATHSAQYGSNAQAETEEEHVSANTWDKREHCERAGRCIGVLGSKLTVSPALRGVLLQLHPPELAGTRFREIQAVLGVRYEVVKRVVTAHPELLLLPEGLAATRANVVGMFMGHENPQQTSALLRTTPELLTCPSPPEDAMLALARTLVPPLAIPELAGLLTAHPCLLAPRHGAAAGGTIAAGVLLALTEHMNLTKEQAVQGVVAAVPILLLRSPGAVRGCCSSISKAFHLEPEALAVVVRSAPSLLLRSPAELKIMSARIKSLLGRSKHWRGGLAALQAKPGALAQTLSFDSSRLDRLQYLISTLRDGGIKWHVALTMPETDWLDMYSGYKGWWAKYDR